MLASEWRLRTGSNTAGQAGRQALGEAVVELLEVDGDVLEQSSLFALQHAQVRVVLVGHGSVLSARTSSSTSGSDAGALTRSVILCVPRVVCGALRLLRSLHVQV